MKKANLTWAAGWLVRVVPPALVTWRRKALGLFLSWNSQLCLHLRQSCLTAANANWVSNAVARTGLSVLRANARVHSVALRLPLPLSFSRFSRVKFRCILLWPMQCLSQAPSVAMPSPGPLREWAWHQEYFNSTPPTAFQDKVMARDAGTKF
jgi:hypothetical protein